VAAIYRETFCENASLCAAAENGIATDAAVASRRLQFFAARRK